MSSLGLVLSPITTFIMLHTEAIKAVNGPKLGMRLSIQYNSVKECVALVVHEEEEEDEMNLRQNFESNPVTQQEFGEYVASLHSCNGSTFILQFEVLLIIYCHITH